MNPALNQRLIHKLAEEGFDSLSARALLGKIGARETSVAAVREAGATGEDALNNVAGSFEEGVRMKQLLDTGKTAGQIQEAAAMLRAQLTKLTAEGTLASALNAIEAQQTSSIVVVRVARGETDEETLKNLIGGIDPDTGAYTGVLAFRAAESQVHVVPKILIAPGFFGAGTPEQTDSLLTALIPIAEKLHAIIVADGPNTNDTAAVVAAKAAANPRVYMVDPFVLNTLGNPVPASAYAAGLIAKVDARKGFWFSPSNQVLTGVTATTRPVDFAFGDADCRAQYLNENGVATIISHDGFRLFRNRTTTPEAKWQFLSVRRTADNLHDALIRSHFWALDRNLSKTYFDDVAESVNAYIAQLRAQGALLGGSCTPSKELNSAANLANGQVTFDMTFTPPYPTERITFRSLLVKNALEERTHAA